MVGNGPNGDVTLLNASVNICFCELLSGVPSNVLPDYLHFIALIRSMTGYRWLSVAGAGKRMTEAGLGDSVIF